MLTRTASDSGRRTRLHHVRERSNAAVLRHLESLGTDDLVRLAQAGDAAAFGMLYRRHVGAVFITVSDHVSDLDHRRELVQEIFTRALAKLATLRDPARFRPWLFQIARNAAIDHRSARRRHSPESLETLTVPPTCSRPTPDITVEAKELTCRVQACMLDLSPRDALVLMMTALLGHGPGDVADALGTTPGNVRVILHRTRRRLRVTLSSEMLLE